MDALSVFGCYGCICRKCLLWWSNRCPYGGCFDEHRAKVNPYDAAHPNEPPRKLWTEWNKPGEQAHWCRGGTCYTTSACEHFIEYNEAKTMVKSCLLANVCIYQDGYIQCSIIDSVGCEECYKRFNQENSE